MHRPGTDPDNVQLSDIICDFCHPPWREDLPVVEGHRGAIICGDCLTAAYRGLIFGESPPVDPGYSCRLCLEQRSDAGWQSPRYPDAAVCARCVRQSAGVLHKDRDYEWEKPTR
jgi:hypothetical protein